jgi:ubiquinone/menaquinone biosynthesis C-methylase UbiE
MIFGDYDVDKKVISGFGDEWNRFDQSVLSEDERQRMFDQYFSIFPWDEIENDAVGFDMGCGSGRWAKSVAPHVGKLYCIDPSSAINVAKKNLESFENCVFLNESVFSLSIKSRSMDFGYSLGVLHHIPDTKTALENCVDRLKSGAPFLLYLYYSFDNRPLWYRFIWKVSEMFRYVVSRFPYSVRFAISQIFAAVVYYPISKFSLLLEKAGLSVHHMPLSGYRKSSFYTMRTDALDRFGTRLEKRYTKVQIKKLMEDAGLTEIIFSKYAPYWCALGRKK